MILACQLCGGVVEIAVAGGGVTLFAYFFTLIANKLRWRQHRRDKCSD